MDSLITFLSTPLFGSYNLVAGIFAMVIGIVTFFSYLQFCYQNYGITQSISITYYYHPTANNPLPWSHNLRWVFQVFMWISLLCIMFIGQNYLYAIVSALFAIMTCNPSVGEPDVKEDPDMKRYYNRWFIPHMISATSAIVLANVGLGICYGYWWMVALIAVILSAIFFISKRIPKEKNKIFNENTTLYWIEVISLMNLIIGMVFGILL